MPDKTANAPVNRLEMVGLFFASFLQKIEQAF